MNEPSFRSVPPNVTWPMVWYRLVGELPRTTSNLGGILVALVLVYRVPEHWWGSLIAAIGPHVFTIIGRSRPVDEP